MLYADMGSFSWSGHYIQLVLVLSPTSFFATILLGNLRAGGLSL